MAESSFEIVGASISLGEARDFHLPVTQSYSGRDVEIPLRVMRGPAPAPTLLLTAAVHGDELDGVGILRELMTEPPFELVAGTLVLVPVVNTAAVHRTNCPSIRADLRDAEVKRLARAFGDELVVDQTGVKGGLRRTACEHGVPAIVLGLPASPWTRWAWTRWARTSGAEASSRSSIRPGAPLPRLGARGSFERDLRRLVLQGFQAA